MIAFLCDSPGRKRKGNVINIEHTGGTKMLAKKRLDNVFSLMALALMKGDNKILFFKKIYFPTKIIYQFYPYTKPPSAIFETGLKPTLF